MREVMEERKSFNAARKSPRDYGSHREKAIPDGKLSRQRLLSLVLSDRHLAALESCT